VPVGLSSRAGCYRWRARCRCSFGSGGGRSQSATATPGPRKPKAQTKLGQSARSASGARETRMKGASFSHQSRLSGPSPDDPSATGFLPSAPSRRQETSFPISSKLLRTDATRIGRRVASRRTANAAVASVMRPPSARGASRHFRGPDVRMEYLGGEHPLRKSR
jgi:hypothetical protein